MNVKKLKLGLIGKDVSKSKSERMHVFILRQMGVECEYELCSASPDNFDNCMRRLIGDFDGFNVTIPYKKDVMEYLEDFSPRAVEFSSVNTVLTKTLKGYNTDGIGFALMLKNAGVSVLGKTVLVLGGGGSGRSTAAVLKELGAKVYMYQRRREQLFETCEQLSILPCDNPESGDFQILVNCTGVGMHESEGLSPVSSQAFDGAEAAIDLIYRPAQSEFLRLAKEKGVAILNGEGMLFYQAYYADCLYLDIQPNEAQAKEYFEKYLAEEARRTENL